MQRLDLPPLVWHLMDPVAATTANDAAPAAPGLPQWQVGQLLVGQVLENLDGQVLALIDGHRLRADWPGPQQVPGARVAFRVVGQAAGQWRLAVVADEQFSEVGSDGILSASSLLAILERLQWPLTYGNVKRLASLFAGQSSAAAADDAPASSELCPPNISVWQQLFGCEPGFLSTVFFTWQPFVCGLFVEEESAGRGAEYEEMAPVSFLFVVDLPHLGQVEVMGRGKWPEQTIVFVARKETVMFLQKKEAELVTLLTEAGMELCGLSLRASESPLLALLRPEMVPYRGLNRRL